MTAASGSTSVLTEGAGRLRASRTERGPTLIELSKTTGISKSTLSRLETGQRRPSLEPLLPIAQAYRVAFGGHDLTMKAGEIAEVDTQVPHWFGAAGDHPVEFLSLLGRPGERANIRAAPRRKSAR